MKALDKPFAERLNLMLLRHQTNAFWIVIRHG
jgi:hypothetical protein